jgi:GTP-binding protein EngB required for normal cell division
MHDETLAGMTRICETFGLEALRPQLQACAEAMQSQGVVDIAILGQFKAGKSSFMNSLAGADVLPVGVLPVTAVVTRLDHGEANRALVKFLDGGTRICSLDELPGYVTERDNPENVKQVASVEVTLQSLAPFRGIRFVDTPGLGSVFAHNTQASLDWLPKVGGALVAIAVNQPLGEQDLKLIQAVSRHTPEVTLLLTKADLVTPDELSAIIAFIGQQAARHLPHKLRILATSTRPGFEPLREAVRRHILDDLAAQHEALAARILDHKLHVAGAACGDYLRLARQAASASATSRAELQTVLQAERAGLPEVRGEIATLARDLQTRVRTRATEHFHRSRGEVARNLRTALLSEMDTWKGHLGLRRERFEQWLGKALESEMARISESGLDFLQPFLEQAQASLHRTVRAFQDRLAQAIERALGLPFEGATFRTELVEPSQPDIRVGKVFDTQVDLLWFLIPMGIFGPLFRRHFLKLLPWEAEKHLARLAHQWAEAGQAALDGLMAQAVAFMNQELTTLGLLAATAEDRGPELEEALTWLESWVQGPGPSSPADVS